jgi:sorting nexin-1/2
VAVGYDGAHTQGSKELEISIRDSQKLGEGVSAYVVYRVCTAASRHGYPTNSDVLRRFSHFSWLGQKLATSFKGCIIPALPEKSAVQKFQMSAEFISHRQRALQVYTRVVHGVAWGCHLASWTCMVHGFASSSQPIMSHPLPPCQVFLNKVATHPVLKDSNELRQFLTANDSVSNRPSTPYSICIAAPSAHMVHRFPAPHPLAWSVHHCTLTHTQEWMLEMARWQAESSAAKPPAVSGALQWLKSLQHSAQNMVSGRCVAVQGFVDGLVPAPRVKLWPVDHRRASLHPPRPRLSRPG